MNDTQQQAGICACGCGGTTKINSYNFPARGWVKGQPRKFISGHNSVGPHAYNWAGGRARSGGYVNVKAPDSPRADSNGRVHEHILIVERVLGKPLSNKHPVHHVDGNGENNANDNLVVCESQAYHMLLERRQRALDACGNADALKCRFCRTYDRQEDLRVFVTTRGKTEGEHRACRLNYYRQLRALRRIS